MPFSASSSSTIYTKPLLLRMVHPKRALPSEKMRRLTLTSAADPVSLCACSFEIEQVSQNEKSMPQGAAQALRSVYLQHVALYIATFPFSVAA